MQITFNIPMYRFFSKEEYLDSMLKNGLVYFNTVRAFNILEDEKYRDLDEGGHVFKVPTKMTPLYGDSKHFPEIVVAQTLKKRRIRDAWAFCGSCSPASKAKKSYAVRVEPVIGFMQQLDYALEKKYGEKLQILFGPVSYYTEEMNSFSIHEQPPYFSKLASYKDDLEFRIVVIPPDSMAKIKPQTFQLPEPNKIFSKALIF